MVAVVALVVLIGLSVVVTRVGSSALEATGVSRDLAHFQARSAFTGVGYTTSEAESIANHQARRSIILVLMLLGNAGTVTVIASLVLGFSGAQPLQALSRFGVLLAGLGGLWLLTSTARFNRWMTEVIRRMLSERGNLEVRDYADLLDVAGGYSVREITVGPGDWLMQSSLSELELSREGVLVLGIRRRSGEYLGAPDGETTIESGDTVLLYGRSESLSELGSRQYGQEGDREHDRAAERQRHVHAAERARDQQAQARERAQQAEQEDRDETAKEQRQRAEELEAEAEHREEQARRQA